jgi:hypothetical protein
MLVLVEAQEEKKKKKQKVKLSQILKDATEGQCFGYLMKVSEITELGEHHRHQITSITSESELKVCVNGLLMSKSGIVDESSTLSVYGYVADDDDILRAYRSLGIDPYYRIKCNRCNMLGDGYHLYRVLEHMNDYHRASFREIGSYLETLGL